MASLPPGPNPITFSDDGRLFVALCFVGDSLYEVDPEGIEAPRLIAENLVGCALNGMDWGLTDSCMVHAGSRVRWLWLTLIRVSSPQWPAASALRQP